MTAVKRTDGNDAATPPSDDEPPDPQDSDPRASSQRLLRVDPESPFAPALDCFLASDRAQLASLAAIANIFLAEVIAALNPIGYNADEAYCHRTIRDSVLGGTTLAAQGEAIISSAADTEDSERVTSSDSSAPSPQLPKFPGYRPTHSIYSWVHGHARSEDMSELAALTGTSITRAYALVRTAIMLVHALPQFHERCLKGDFTIEHVTTTARACQDLPFPDLPAVDDYLAVRRADTTIETFKKGLYLKVVTLQPMEETIERTAVRRRVDFGTDGNGTGFLTLTGPAPELYACYRRIEGFARAVHSGNTSAFGIQLRPDEKLNDERGVKVLMYDIMSRTSPEVTVTVTRTNRRTGTVRTSDVSAGSLLGFIHKSQSAVNANGATGIEAFGVPSAFSTDAAFGTAADPGPANSSASPSLSDLLRGFEQAGPDDDVSYDVRLSMPTHAQWLNSQADVTVTVPALTLLGKADLPGTLPDGSPIPADMARDLAAHSSTWSRILTDPAVGTPLDAKSTTYAIPRNVRRTLTAQWVTCTIPGCTLRAENSEIDHIIPFNHEDPDHGGRTLFGNLHPLCKAHHQSKTDRKFFVRSAGPLCLEYVFRHGTNVRVHAPDNPINIAQALLFADLGSNSSVPRQQIVGRFHYRGERTTSAERPGPAPNEGRPGWVEGPPDPWSEYPNTTDLNTELREWHWESDDPPPF